MKRKSVSLNGDKDAEWTHSFYSYVLILLTSILVPVINLSIAMIRRINIRRTIKKLLLRRRVLEIPGYIIQNIGIYG